MHSRKLHKILPRLVISAKLRATAFRYILMFLRRSAGICSSKYIVAGLVHGLFLWSLGVRSDIFLVAFSHKALIASGIFFKSSQFSIGVLFAGSKPKDLLSTS
jgi:hypothetical protein